VALSHKVPGVCRKDVYVRPVAPLPTGVPGFVGFGQAVDPKKPVPALHRAEDLAGSIKPADDSYLADVVVGFFTNGGVRCYVVGAAAADADREKSLKDALELLAPLEDLDLVAVPDAMILPEKAAQRVQSAAIAHCGRHGNRFAILDAPGGRTPNDLNAVDDLKTWRRQLARDNAQPANAALYYPWVKVPSADIVGGRSLPPCGHVAGIFARSDARVGVFKAPANEELIGVLDLEFMVDAAAQERLNPEGINCLRAFPGRGLRVWGARTLSLDANWLYISVRRLVLTLARWIDRNMGWAAFEANTPRLWNRIQRELNVYLGQLWQAGALKGASAAEAFYVKCDSETNPTDEREQGRVTTEIGLAPASPAEFVVVRIIHRPGAAQLG
jgi:phage tail sheath protein FI